MKKNSYRFLFAFVFIFPFFLLIVVGLSDEWMYPKLFPSHLTVSHIKLMLQGEPHLKEAILNSLLLAFLSTLGCLVIGLPAAKVLATQNVVSDRFMHWLIYVPLILPSVSIIAAIQTTFIQWQLTGTFTGVILIHVYFSLPYAMQLLVPIYRQIGDGYEHTAKVLGASKWKIWQEVTLPMLRPSLKAASTMCFIISISQYLPTFFIGGGKIMTLPLIMLPYAQNGRYQLAAIYSLLFLIVSMLGIQVMQRMIMKKGGKVYGAQTNGYFPKLSKKVDSV